MAARKEKQLETLRAALGIKGTEEPSEREVQDQKQENGAPSSDNEESDSENDQHEKKDSKHHGTVGKEMVEDLKSVKDSKKEMKEWEGKNDDGRGFKIVHDKEIGKGKHNYSSDSDGSGKHGGRGKNHKDNTSALDSEDDFDMSSKKSIKNASNKQVRGGKLQGNASDSDSYSSKENARKRAQSYIKKQKRHDTDSSSDSDLSKQQFRKHRTKSRRTETDDSRSGTDDSRSDSGYEKKHRRKMVIEHKRRSKRHKTISSDSDSGDKYGIHNKKRDRNSRRRDSDDMQDEGDDGKRNIVKGMEKISKPSSRRQESDESRKRNKKHGKSNRKMDVANVKTNPEVIKIKREKNQHTDDESSNSERSRKRTLKAKQQLSDGRKQQDFKRKLNSTDESNRSDSDYDSDNSDDSIDYNQARHGNRKAGMELDDRRNNKNAQKHRFSSEGFRYRTDGKYDGGKDRIANQNIDKGVGKSIRKTEVKEGFADILDSKSESAGLKEREKERDIRGYANHGQNSEDQRVGDSLYSNNREKLSVKEHPTDGRHGSRSHTKSHDDTKRRRYGSAGEHRSWDSYEHKHGQVSGRHERKYGEDSDRPGRR